MMYAPEALPVFICNPDGAFLARLGHQWGFTLDRSRAHVFDYHGDEIAVQLRQAWSYFGVDCDAFPVDPQLATEKCDDCCRTLLCSTDAHFDGSRYLCPACVSRPGRQVA
jgi:hypothetical protein